MTTGNIPKSIPLTQIDPNPSGIQPRTQLDQDAVERYANNLREDTEQPAIEIMEIKGTSLYRIIDGYHRYAAHGIVKRKTIRAMVRKGTMVDAKEEAIKLNGRHGVPLSSSERKVALLDLLDEYQQRGISRSQRELANITGMPKTTIARIIKEHETESGFVLLDDEPQSQGQSQSQTQGHMQPKTASTGSEGGNDGGQSRSNGPPLCNPSDDDGPKLAAGEIVLHDSSRAVGEVSRMISMAKKRIGEIVDDPGCDALKRHRPQLDRGLTDLGGMVRACTPDSVCPQCDGSGGECTVCKGARVLCSEQTKQMKQDSSTGLRKRDNTNDDAKADHW